MRLVTRFAAFRVFVSWVTFVVYRTRNRVCNVYCEFVNGYKFYYMMWCHGAPLWDVQ